MTKVIGRLIILLALAAAATGCGVTTSAGKDPRSELTGLIRGSLNVHRDYHVRSVSCPRFKPSKGHVVNCSVTLRGGHIMQVRATELDGKGTYHLVGSVMFADNLEHGIVTILASRDPGATAHCPAYVPVRIGRTFDCAVTDPRRRHLTAVVTILDHDGGYGVHVF
jgi:hypothetical protein